MNSPKRKSYPEKIGDFPGLSPRNFFEIPEGERRKVYRIIDANLNRSREGLRVCEEVIRFIFNDVRLTKDLRKLRHDITKIAKSLPLSPKELLSARDIRFDVGKDFAKDNNNKRSYDDIFMANMERAEEALRVLEEFSHILDEGTSDGFRSLRFQLYSLEKKIIARFPALSNTG